MMIFTILSYFDNLVGPRVFLKIPKESTCCRQLELVPLVMDLYKQGFFIHNFGGIKTANLIFEIKSPKARGHKENLMITIASPEEYNLELSTFKDIMEYFTRHFQTIENIYKGFYEESRFSGAQESYEQIVNFVLSFHEILPKEQELYTQKVTKMFSYGLSSVGKDSIIKDLQERFSPCMHNSPFPEGSKDIIPF